MPRSSATTSDRLAADAQERAFLAFARSIPAELSRSPSLAMVLLESPRSADAQAVTRAVTRSGLPVELVNTNIAQCEQFGAELRAGHCLPVGSAHFVRACMHLAGIEAPRWTCYPRELARYMLQAPRRTTAAACLQMPRPVFVKAVTGKAFSGFVLREEAQMGAFDRLQLHSLLRLAPDTPVWMAHALELISEWRYYVLYGEVLGYARYEPPAKVATASGFQPPLEEMSTMIAATPHDGGYALDVAVLAGGELTLLGVRDAWALSFVAGAPHQPEPLDYLKLLWTRWAQIYLEARDRVAANSAGGEGT